MVVFIIGIIDSGLGGLNVLNKLIANKKYNKYILFLDYLYAPFGNKNECVLLSRLKYIINFLKDKGCKNIIIACNTMSIIANKYKIIDVITTLNYYNRLIKDNFDNSSILIATTYSIDNNYYDVKSFKEPFLASYIEGNSNTSIINKYDKYNKIFLACTHYSLKAKLFKEKKIYDISSCLANNINIINDKLDVTIYTSKINNNIKNHILKNYHLYKINIKIKQ